MVAERWLQTYLAKIFGVGASFCSSTAGRRIIVVKNFLIISESIFSETVSVVAAFSVICSGVSFADWILLPLSSTLSSSSLLGHCVGKITKVLVEAKLVIGKFVGGSAAQTASLSQASVSAQ